MTDDPIKLRSDLTDDKCMRLALHQAEEAYAHGEVPIGAVVIWRDRVVARAYNQVEMLRDATAHAEMIAITQAEAAIEDWRLSEATLYVTKEPCAMCAGAMVNARLGRLVFGCSDSRMGAAGGALSITDFPGMLHRVEVTGGILAAECQELIQAFFRERRNEQKERKDGRPDVSTCQ